MQSYPKYLCNVNQFGKTLEMHNVALIYTDIKQITTFFYYYYIGPITCKYRSVQGKLTKYPMKCQSVCKNMKSA